MAEEYENPHPGLNLLILASSGLAGGLFFSQFDLGLAGLFAGIAAGSLLIGAGE